jgi:hypothetical protein
VSGLDGRLYEQPGPFGRAVERALAEDAKRPYTPIVPCGVGGRALAAGHAERAGTPHQTMIGEVPPALGSCSTPGLLDAMIQLTHRIHTADAAVKEGTSRPGDYVVSTRTSRADQDSTALRAQRHLIRAEVLRRTSDAT